MVTAMVLGVSGDVGSFSEEAGLQYAKKIGVDPVFEYLIDMEGVLAAIESNKVDIGIFPVVNLRGGLVNMAFEAMGNHNFRMLDELWLDVHQCLLAQKGTQLTEIKNIVSHQQAIAQCQRYIQTKLSGVTLIQSQDTAQAARELSEGKMSPFSAVIASQHAANIYNLDVIAKDIQDDKPNLTAFIIVKKHS